MKNIYKFIWVVIFVNYSNAQINVINVYDGIYHDSPAGTYLKDTENSFDKFLGTWKWQDGNNVLIFKIEKVTQYLYQEYGVYKDFIKGNYSYSVDGGNTYITNTIVPNLGNNDPNINPMYSVGTTYLNKLNYSFTDVLKNKERCTAYFKFLPNSLTQAEMKLGNDGIGYLLPDLPPDPTFSIPDNVIVTKQ